jgi:mRNA-degrading endonuclease RelE of RelBE toxin-antitoxin system
MPYFVWELAAQAALRAIPRLQARQILIALNQYARSAQGNVAHMRGEPAGRLRLRCGDYRVIFRKSGADQYQILKVGHRREIYREE